MWPHDTAPTGGVAPVGYRCWQLTIAPPSLDADDAAELLDGHFPTRSDAVDAYLSWAPEPGSWRTLLVCSAAAHAALTAQPVQCWSVTCTRCGQDLTDLDAGFEVHYPDPESAEAGAAAAGWARLPGGGLLCPDCRAGMRWGELLEVLHPENGWPERDDAWSSEPSVDQLGLDDLGGAR